MIVYKYPNMENAGKVVYQDSNGTCFVYKTTEVNCDKNEDRITTYPLQN